MPVVYPRCCGLDVHQKTVVACRMTLDAKGRRHRETRTFGTMTQELLGMADWLAEAECTHIAMESFGRRLLEARLQPAGRAVRSPGGERPTLESHTRS